MPHTNRHPQAPNLPGCHPIFISDNAVTYVLRGVTVEVPIVIGRPRGRVLVIRCPYCAQEHEHGTGGTRVPHCDSRVRAAVLRERLIAEYYVRPEGSTARFHAWGEVEHWAGESRSNSEIEAWGPPGTDQRLEARR